MGQAATLRVTVLGPTWFPVPPEFPGFDLPNAMIRLPPDSTWPTSERRDSGSWNGLIREYLFRPLQPGRFRIEIRSMHVTYVGPEDGEHHSIGIPLPPVDLLAIVPAGAEQLTPFLSGSTLALSQEIQGRPDSLRPGSALKRVVSARIEGNTAVLLPPLVKSEGERGLRVYPEHPVFSDAGGSGERRDTVAYVFERPGDYRLPPIRIQYWNTASQQIETAELDAVEVSVRSGLFAPLGDPPILLAGLAFLTLTAVVALRAGVTPRSAARGFRRLSRAARDSEWRAYLRLLAAVRRGEAHTALRLFVAWDEHPRLAARPTSRGDWLLVVRAAAFGPPERRPQPASSRRRLILALRAERRARRRGWTGGPGTPLPPLNPAGGRSSAVGEPIPTARYERGGLTPVLCNEKFSAYKREEPPRAIAEPACSSSPTFCPPGACIAASWARRPMRPSFDLRRTDSLLHAPVRLAVMAMLGGGDAIDFTHLREHPGLTGGNLASHLRKLEEAGYVHCAKSLLGRRPRSTYTIRARGRSALARHVEQLEQLVAASRSQRERAMAPDGRMPTREAALRRSGRWRPRRCAGGWAGGPSAGGGSTRPVRSTALPGP